MLLFILCNVLSTLIVLCHCFGPESFGTYGNIIFSISAGDSNTSNSLPHSFCDFVSRFMVQATLERLRGNVT